MKILFVYAPIKVKYNHGLALLKAICKKNKIEADICSVKDVNEFITIIQDYSHIGFSILGLEDFNILKPFFRIAKNFGKITMVGGIFLRRGMIDCIDGIDYVCKGEGEILTDFLLNDDTDIFENKYFHHNLDTLPLPDYSDVSGFEFSRGQSFLNGLKIIPYSTSRGCPFSCNFCEASFQPKQIRIKSTIRKDMDYLQNEFKPDLFYILDELLPYYNSLWKKQWEYNFSPYMCYIRADISDELLNFLCDTGLRVTAFGIESGNEKYRNNILNKNLFDKDIFRVVSILNKKGIKYIPFFMHNTPFETLEIKEDTQLMLKRIGGFPIVWEYQDLKNECGKAFVIE